MTRQVLGATPEVNDSQDGYRFSVRSPAAQQVTLCLFDEHNNETQHAMHAKEGTWQVWVADVMHGQRYGFRVSGESTAQQPFNPKKLLLDPYGKGVVGKPKLAHDDDYAYFLMNDERDNASVAPKSHIVDEAFDWDNDKPPQTPWAESVIYEMHVKGFTQLHPDVAPDCRGSYAGLSSPAVIAYLQQLGVTAVELLPIAYGIDEPHLQRQGLSNYWNYNTLAPFAIESNYWSGRCGTTPLSEFQSTVKTLHAAGIEVILDVVFNHSAEAEHHHPTFYQRGLANADFYWLNAGGSCVNHTGCGNTINAANPATQDWIIDCLCYWVTTCHVDGFRFDLGTVLGREPDFNPQAKLFTKIANEPRLHNIKLIAEPWDIGAFGYQLGNFPTRFAEWNDRFRDDIREFFIYQSGQLGDFAERLAGSSDIFKGAERPPHSTVNLITAHDGFTLADVVAYNDKHNHANGEDNRDGHSHNISDNHGVEGDSDNPDILAARGYTQRALLSALLLSNGTPMLLAGDEIGHSQRGNNNAYCQDNAITWIDWKSADKSLLDFTRQCIRWRRQIPSLNRDGWWNDKTVEWLTVQAQPMQIDDWHHHATKAFTIRLDGNFLLLINGKRSEQTFALPAGYWRDTDNRIHHTAIAIHHLAIVLLVNVNKETDHA